MMVSLAFVAPDIVEALIEGKLPRGIGITRLVNLPLNWDAQRETVYTRRGEDWTARFPHIAKAASALPQRIIDGEAILPDKEGHSDFSALQSAIAGGNKKPIGALRLRSSVARRERPKATQTPRPQRSIAAIA